MIDDCNCNDSSLATIAVANHMAEIIDVIGRGGKFEFQLFWQVNLLFVL